MAHTTTDPSVRRGSIDPVLRATQVLAVATVVALLWQFVSAGELVGPAGQESWEGAHAVGAIVLHVVSGLAAIAAAARWRLRGAPVWPTALAAVVFVLTFVQAYFGGGQTLWIHVPGAMVLAIGAVWLAVWSFRPGPARSATAR